MFTKSIKIVGVMILALNAMGWFLGDCAFADSDYKLTMNINREGTAGFAVGTEIAVTVSKNTPLKISGMPYSSPVAGIRDSSKGKCNIPYMAALGLQQVYENEGSYKINPVKNKPYQGFYLYDADLFFAVKADRDDINCIADINNKKVFPGKSNSGISEGFKNIFKILNIKIKQDVQMGYMDVPSALKTGLVDVVGVYCLRMGQDSPSWVKNLEQQVKLKVIKFSPSDVVLLKKGLLNTGVGVAECKIPFKNITGSTYMVTEWWGWGFAGDVSEDAAYQFMKGLFKKESTLRFKVGHRFLSRLLSKEDFIYGVTEGINSIPKIPVHPGVARYYKEIGCWQDNWVTK